jgi:riboflavin synthase
MFSGIVEEAGVVTNLTKEGGNLHLTLRCSFTHELRIDQSLAHNGVCLTVVDLQGDTYTVTAIQETLDKSNLGQLKVGDKVNLERSMMMNGRLDGHIVQGHVDQVATCTSVTETDGSWRFRFEYAYDTVMARQGYLTVEKGSVTVNGVSLTVCNAGTNSFEVSIIPYTFEHTNFHQINVGSLVNLEFDIIGKYISRLIG